MMAIIFPANVSLMFSQLIPIVMFDVLENDDINPHLVLDFDGDEMAQDIPDQIRDLGYDSHSAILNLGSLGVLVILYFFRVGMVLCLKIVNKLTGKCGTVYKNLYN